MEKNLYEILGVSKDATQDEIKKAYRKLSLKYHPDRHTSDTPEEQKKNEELFKEVTEAYDILGNQEKRKQYDNPYSDINSEFEDFFYNPFARRKQKVERGNDCFVKVSVNLEDLFKEIYSKEFEYHKNVRCSECNGEGGTGKHKCANCNGSGRLIKSHRNGNMFYQQDFGECPNCNGTGFIVDNKCKKCNGTGFENTIAKFDLNLPNEYIIQDGVKIIVSESDGNESKDKNGPNGRLIVLISHNFDKNKYEVSGYDVVENVEINWYDALLGLEIIINHPSGKQIKVKISEYCKHGNLLKLSKQGILNKGNYYIRVFHKYPDKMNKEVKKKLEEIKEICK